jgi:hypothetical protein
LPVRSSKGWSTSQLSGLIASTFLTPWVYCHFVASIVKNFLSAASFSLLQILPRSEGRIVTEFDPRIAEMRVSYIYSEHGEVVEGDEVISIDLMPTIRAFCEEFHDDPSCQCLPGQVFDDGECVPDCPPGQELVGGEYVW